MFYLYFFRVKKAFDMSFEILNFTSSKSDELFDFAPQDTSCECSYDESILINQQGKVNY